jgi:hypothetical protein
MTSDENVSAFSFHESLNDIKSATPLEYSRECELAIENYSLRKELHDVGNVRMKLKDHVRRMKSALLEEHRIVEELR